MTNSKRAHDDKSSAFVLDEIYIAAFGVFAIASHLILKFCQVPEIVCQLP